jgi:hypothetical protein
MPGALARFSGSRLVLITLGGNLVPRRQQETRICPGGPQFLNDNW